MPIYEYYCPDNHRIYQFYAKTLAQGRTIPKCPDNPEYRMQKLVSAFAVVGKRKGESAGGEDGPAPVDPGSGTDPKMDAAMAAMEQEFANVDENDPRAMGRMMRRMSEVTGEKIDGEMEEVVRKLEEGADPDSLEEQFGGAEGDPAEEGAGFGEGGPGPAGGPVAPERAEGERARPKRARREFRGQPSRDPKLYDY